MLKLLRGGFNTDGGISLLSWQVCPDWHVITGGCSGDFSATRFRPENHKKAGRLNSIRGDRQ